MILHATVTMDLLDETNHRLIALGVKVDVVTGTDSRESTRTVTKRIITNIVLNIVPEVANKSLTIAQFDSKCLIVNCTPGAIDGFAITFVFCRALLCSCLEAIEELRSINGLLWELEAGLGRDNLHLVGLLMRAHLISFEKVHGVDLRINMEVPSTKDVVLEAMDWLISSSDIVDRQVIQKAGYCQRAYDAALLLCSLLFHFR